VMIDEKLKPRLNLVPRRNGNNCLGSGLSLNGVRLKRKKVSHNDYSLSRSSSFFWLSNSTKLILVGSVAGVVVGLAGGQLAIGDGIDQPRSGQSLWPRIRYQYHGNAESSTLRLTPVASSPIISGSNYPGLAVANE
jgi:hypothetical protein